MNARTDPFSDPYPRRKGETVLLLDETLIEEEEGIRREVQPCEKLPFVMEPDEDRPWEYCGPGMSKRIHLYGTVLYDELVGKYRMWYFGRMGPHWRVPAGNYQVPGLFIPRTDERPFHCNGVTADGYGRRFVDNDRGDLTLYAESEDGIHWTQAGAGYLHLQRQPGQQRHLGPAWRLRLYRSRRGGRGQALQGDRLLPALPRHLSADLARRHPLG